MVEYKCEKCNKIFNHKGNYIYHIQRKNSCTQVLENMPTAEVITPQTVIKKAKEKIPYHGLTNNLTIYNADFTQPVCVYCNKSFSSNSHRNRHMNTVCPLRRRYIELIELFDKEIDNLLIENRFLKNKYLSLFGDKYLFPFGMEKFLNIDPNLIVNCIKNPFKGLPEIVAKYHFNPKELRYHNIRMKTPKNMHLEVYNGTQWIFESKDNVLTTLIRTYKDIVDMEVDTYAEKISAMSVKNYNDFSEAIDYYVSYFLYDCQLSIEQKRIYKPIYQRMLSAMELMMINTFRKDEIAEN